MSDFFCTFARSKVACMDMRSAHGRKITFKNSKLPMG